MIYQCTYRNNIVWDEFMRPVLANTKVRLEREGDALDLLDKLAPTVIDDSKS